MIRKNGLIAVAAGSALVLLGVFLGLLSFHIKESVSFPGVRFGSGFIRLIYATTESERELGLGNRTYLPPDEGMLFVFPKDGFYGFWMKDTLIPLDLFWLDDQGQVVSMDTEVATSTFPDVFYSTAPARYVLETNAGFAGRYGVAPGTSLDLQNIPIVSK